MNPTFARSLTSQQADRRWRPATGHELDTMSRTTATVLRYAIARGRAPLVWSTLLGATGGLAATGLLTVTARALGSGAATLIDVTAFVGLACGFAVVRYYSSTMSLRFTQNELAEMAYELSHAVVHAPLRRVEELGGDRLMAALTDALNSIARAVVELPLLVTNAVIVIGCFAYLGLFSSRVLLLVFASPRWPSPRT